MEGDRMCHEGRQGGFLTFIQGKKVSSLKKSPLADPLVSTKRRGHPSHCALSVFAPEGMSSFGVEREL